MNSFNRSIIKVAKTKEEKPRQEPLRPHAIRALKKLENSPGLLLDHSMGSGKTRLFLTAIERAQAKNKDPKARSLIVAPASLVSNIEKEVKKHHLKVDLSKVDALSYEKATLMSDELAKNKYLLAIADEGQKLRNTGTKRHKSLESLFQGADKRLIASATPGYNHVSDYGALINLAAGKKVLPDNKQDFESEYVATSKLPQSILRSILGAKPVQDEALKNTDKLGKILNKYVDKYDLRKDKEAQQFFPEKNESTVEVKMSPEQMGVYKYMEDTLPMKIRMKVRANLPLDKQDSARMNIYSQGVRQASNSIRPVMPSYQHSSPKIQEAMNRLRSRMAKDKEYKGLVYSNYMNAGLKEYAEELKRTGVPHAVYHGGLSAAEKDKIIEDFNGSGRKVLLVSSSGAEGLNLKGTRHVQVLEPHYNKSKIDQVIGRASRFKSHEHLPKEKRKVDVEHFVSVFPDTLLGGRPKDLSIDQYLYRNSRVKDKLSEQARALVKSE